MDRMDKNKRADRQKWLLEMADMFDETGRAYGEKTIEQMHVDNFILDWMRDALFFAKQFRRRAEMYDFDIIKNQETDADLKRAAMAANAFLKKIIEQEFESGEDLTKIAAFQVELEHILKCLEGIEV